MLSTRHFRLSTSSGFTIVELMVTVGIFVAMTALLVARYGSFNDGTLLTSMAYDVALTLRTAQSYGLNVQGVSTTTSLQGFNYPYGIHFSSASTGTPLPNTQLTFFADTYNVSSSNGTPDGVYTYNPGNPTQSDVIVAPSPYVIARNGTVKSVCAGTGPGGFCASATSVDITFKRPDPNAIIVPTPANNACGNANQCAYAEIVVQNSGQTSTRTIVVRGTGLIAVQGQ